MFFYQFTIMEFLPDEIIIHILYQLRSVSSLMSFYMTSKYYYEFRNEKSCWKWLFQHDKLKRHFLGLKKMHIGYGGVFNYVIQHAFTDFKYIYVQHDSGNFPINPGFMHIKMYLKRVPLIYKIDNLVLFGSNHDCAEKNMHLIYMFNTILDTLGPINEFYSDSLADHMYSINGILFKFINYSPKGAILTNKRTLSLSDKLY